MTRNWRGAFYGLLAVALLVTAVPAAAVAQTETERPPRPAVELTDEQRTDRLEAAKRRITAQIERRLTALDRLAGKIDRADHISDSHAATLLADIDAARRVLQAGIDAVAAAETVAELREIAPPIFETTLVFALLGPKTHAVAASDGVATATRRFTEIGTNLQEALDRLDAAGVDTAQAQADLDEIGLLGPKDHASVIVSNGVDIDGLPFSSDTDRERARWELLDLAGVDPYSDRPIATFIGSSHEPNVSAANLLIAAAKRRPEWLFILAGSHSSVFAESSAPLPANVTLVPVFDEGLLWPLIAGANVAANPMVSGGGSNLKIFDYLAVGTPVLATPIGARGLADPTSLIELVEPTLDAIVDGLDRLIEPELAGVRRERSRRGRDFVVSNVSWRILGQRWSAALGDLVGGWTGPVRPPLETATPIILLDTRPPSPDPVVATMQQVGIAAIGGHPTDREITMDPAFREHIRKATANKNVGRELPDDARLALPKKALIRAGHALSNEQAVFNDAALDAMDRLMGVINDLQRDQLALTDRLLAAETALANRTAEPGNPDQLGSGGSPLTSANLSTAPATESPELDAFYEAFEDAFRGDAADVRASLSGYLEQLTDLPEGPIVDVGCGRGEWLQLLANSGHRAYGYDTNRVAIERSLALGVDARHGDGVAHLETIPAGSVAAVSSFHVVEHLTFAELHRFAVAAHRALMPGGRLIIETPNCLNVQVGASSFWLDPTHRAPVHPEQLRFLMEHVGFTTVDVFGRNPDDATTPTDLDPDPARNGLLVEFHRLVFGSVDLAVVATKHR